jgi:hypothetical protein
MARPFQAVVARRASAPFVQHMVAAQQREREHITAELVKVKGFMPLLMKRRNGDRWTVDERHQLIEQLNAMAHLSPYLVVLILPGSFLALPLLAWWLDRRRYRRNGSPLPQTAHPNKTTDT